MTKEILIKDKLKKMTFDDVYKRYKNLVYDRALRWLTNIRNSSMYDKEDLLQIGNIGLWKAYMSYNKDKGIQFTTWACIKIDGDLKRNYRDTYIRKFNRKGAQVKEICSLQEVVVLDDGKPLCREDYIADQKSEQFIENICLRNDIDKLQKEYRDVIYKRFYKGMTERAIGKTNGYSQAHASRMVRKSLNDLKAIMI